MFKIGFDVHKHLDVALIVKLNFGPDPGYHRLILAGLSLMGNYRLSGKLCYNNTQ